MKRLILAAALLAAAPAWAAYDGPLVETAGIADQGDLPPIAERVPAEPLIVDLEARDRTPGVHGGTIRMFVSRSKDVRYMAVWGYARLIGYNEAYELVPDILHDYQVADGGRSVTLTLRKGHRWSNGDPFTTEDFRYWWENVALNPDLSPSGPPSELLVNGEKPIVTVINDQTIRYQWPAPNPRFLPALAQARPVYIYRPSTYMKRYHKDFIKADALEKLQADGKKWTKIHNKKDNLYKFDNPKLPVLQPWVNTMKKNSQRYVLVRNPYYHRIDSQGRQLPYADQVELEIAASGLIPLKASRGQATLQIRSLGFSDAPVLKQMEGEGAYQTRLWRSGFANEVALYPNLNYNDQAWRDVMRDVRFRRAISLGISRKAINKVLYFGQAVPQSVTALMESPFYDEENAAAWTDF
ncbi:MAG: ABC transporter substrate-binding protein, partial [Pseudomonadota bacterium]